MSDLTQQQIVAVLKKMRPEEVKLGARIVIRTTVPYDPRTEKRPLLALDKHVVTITQELIDAYHAG